MISRLARCSLAAVEGHRRRANSIFRANTIPYFALQRHLPAINAISSWQEEVKGTVGLCQG